jgi:metal-responsive CopG/Arc/MetJ family transcriptional regulator
MRKPARENKITILLNESEYRTLNRFCDKYGVTNRSRLIREALMKAILKKMESDQPTLFD